MMNRHTGLPKGFGFVRFCMPISAASALDSLDGRELNGRAVRVNAVVEQASTVAKAVREAEDQLGDGQEEGREQQAKSG
eukprot:CAMPEP_0205916548 /NCGR_PEP_ID=MMETSP1325-20131115/8581_1 /ASSEMBLY_ACC=CAM_ASM_000708 /TAXON_ID=236786 /ORGANISM="Florenciella sp., Strain RCC1007" /LENGTH=78 /DNA_ID=CAMNT_0053283847 /DNA_START=16 /DNA_END=248 /DNA_ORIENTATION=-